MNADRLLSHFERISEAPDAVDRLRRFILDLAVRGKLVEQDPVEGNATVLVAQHHLTLDTSDDLHPFAVPDSWAWVTVGSVCSKTGSGSTPRGGKSAYVSKGIPFLRSQNVHDDGLHLDDVAYIDTATHHKMIGTAVRPDDLLLNITGGSLGRCCRVPHSFTQGNVSQHVAILRVAIPGTQAFLHTCIISPFFQSLIFDEQTGAGRGGLPKNRMDRLPMPLPPLAEQHRIVAKMDELMQLCDRLEASQQERESRRDRVVVASLNRLSQPADPDQFKKDAGFQLSNLNRLTTKPEHIKELRKAILSLAVRGKLVPQDEEEGTAEALLGHITAQMPPKKETDEKQLGSGARWTIPPAWQWTRMKYLCSRVTSGATPSKELFHESSGVPFLKVYNIRNQQIDFGYKPQFISQAYHETKMKRSTLQPGDVVMNIVGPPLGKVAIIPDDYPQWNCNQAIVVFKLVQPELAPYAYWFLRENSFLDEIDLIGTAGQDNISVTKSQNIAIPLPPLAEQKRIVAKVDELMLICDQLETQLESQRRGRRQLLEALLHEALEGVG